MNGMNRVEDEKRRCANCQFSPFSTFQRLWIGFGDVLHLQHSTTSNGLEKKKRQIAGKWKWIVQWNRMKESFCSFFDDVLNTDT